MKNLLILITIMLVGVGCGKTEPKPLSPEEQKLVGSYESSVARPIPDDPYFTLKLDLHENGKVGSYANEGLVVTWKIIENEVHVVFEGFTEVFEIEPNGDLTEIANIEGGNRTDHPKEEQYIFKKLKE